MIKTEDTYKKALDEKKERLAKKNAEREQYLNAIYSANHRLSEIDSQMAVYGPKIAITALSGDKEALLQLQDKLLKLNDEKQKIVYYLRDKMLDSYLKSDCSAVYKKAPKLKKHKK